MPSAQTDLDTSLVALFLDVDGTLLDIRDDPAEVAADHALTGLLRACADKLNGALALVSGRSVTELDRIFAPAVFPVAGAHGAELRFDGGRTQSMSTGTVPRAALSRLEQFVAANEGLLLERKRGGVSLHYRRMPELEDECRKLVVALMAEFGNGFRLIAGKMVFEIAPDAHNKGAAIRSFLEQAPFTGRVPVYVGDDVTDEDAFIEVNSLEGISIRVGGSSESEARFELPDVASVRCWLSDAILGNRQELKPENNGVE